ncbi:MAG: VCBS repeat-containing protein, partial [Planctomycetes bacterium]|nr:VCBS repeat-containing protein [Planctomycetota bacterium]
MPSPNHATLAALLLPVALVAQQGFAELPRRHLPQHSHTVGALAAIDVDTDGDLDLLIGGFQDPSAIWLNDGFGTFTVSSASYAFPISMLTTALAVGDVNGDSQPDVLWGTIGGGLELLLGGGGILSSAPGSYLPAGIVQPACLALFDFDGDLDLDLLVGGTGSPVGSFDRLLENDGSGRFTDVTGLWLGTGGNTVTAIVPFDCDGDSDLDLLMTSYQQPPLLLRNTGTSFQPSPLPPVPPSGTCAAAGDVDGDGDLDLVLGYGAPSPPLQRQDRLLLNSGTGTFTDATATAMPMIDNFTTTVHLTDVDGDGDLDVLASHQQTTFLGNRLGHTLLLGDGAGNFTDGSAALPQNDLTAARAMLPDVDGDGDDDYVFAGHGQHLYWNDHGTYVHATGAAIPYRSGTTEGVAAGDLDGDGLPELVAAGWNFSILSGRNSVLWNDGAGHLADDPTAPAFPNGIYSCAAIGDVDNDGDQDLVFGLDQPGLNRLYRNDGSRVLTDVTASA